MTDRRFTLMFLLGLVLLSFWLPASAQNREPNPQVAESVNNKQKPLRPLLQLLNPTPEQIKQIRTIRREFSNELFDAKQRRIKAELALQKEIVSEKPDESIIEQRLQELAEAQKAYVKLDATTALKMQSIFTPEQRTSLRNLYTRLEERANQSRPQIRKIPSLNRK